MVHRYFTYNELFSLLDYLTDQGANRNPPTEFVVSFTMGPEPAPIHIPGLGLMRCRTSSSNTIAVRTRSELEHIFEYASIYNGTIDRITWTSHDDEKTVRIRCKRRIVEVSSDSISFVEICRHMLTGQNVRRFTADLTMQ